MRVQRLNWPNWFSHPPESLYILLFMAFVLGGFGIWWGVVAGSPEDWASDTILPRDVFQAASFGFQNGWHSRYPPFHYELLTVLYAPLLILHYFDFINVTSYPEYTLLLYLGRLLSLGTALMVVILVYLWARELKIGARGAVLASVITTFTPMFVYYSKMTNLDMPYTMWFLASMLFVTRALKTHSQFDYVMFFIFATLAITTKDQAYGLYVLIVPIVVYSSTRHDQQRSFHGSWAGLYAARRLLVPVFAAGVLFSTIYLIPLNLEGFVAHIKLIVGASNNYRIYENSLFGHLLMLKQSIKQIAFAMGWPFFVICVIGAIEALRRKPSNHLLMLPLVSAVSYYIFFIGIVGYNYDRFFLPILAALSIYGGQQISNLVSYQRLPKFVTRATVLAILAYGLVYASSVNMMIIADSRYKALNWIEQNIADDKLIAGIGATYYLPPLNSNQARYLGKNPSVMRIKEIDPDFIVISSIYDEKIFREGTEGFTFFRMLLRGDLGYELVYQNQEKPIFSLLNRNGIFTNLDKINPEIRIFKKR